MRHDRRTPRHRLLLNMESLEQREVPARLTFLDPAAIGREVTMTVDEQTISGEGTVPLSELDNGGTRSLAFIQGRGSNSRMTLTTSRQATPTSRYQMTLDGLVLFNTELDHVVYGSTGTLADSRSKNYGEMTLVRIDPSPGQEHIDCPVQITITSSLQTTSSNSPYQGLTGTSRFFTRLDTGNGVQTQLDESVEWLPLINGKNTSVTKSDTFTAKIGDTFMIGIGTSFKAVNVGTRNVSPFRSTLPFNVTLEAAPVPVVTSAPDRFSVGPENGGNGRVAMFNASRSRLFTTDAFAPNLAGGVRTAAADLTGDGVADMIVATGEGVSPRLRIIDGSNFQEVLATAPFEASFKGGMTVTVGDVNNDGVPDIIITPDNGGGPRVRIFDGRTLDSIADFFGIEDNAFRGGARAAVGDVNGDGRPDLVVGAGYTGGPRIAVFDGSRLLEPVPASQVPPKLMADFFAFEESVRDGAYVAVGDINGDCLGDLIFGGGPNGGPRVRAASASQLLQGGIFKTLDLIPEAELANFFAGDASQRGGIRVVVKDLDGDQRADILTGAGPGGGSRVNAYGASALLSRPAAPQTIFSFDAFTDVDGVFVG